MKSVLKFARDEPTPKWVENLNSIVQRTAELARPYVEERGGESGDHGARVHIETERIGDFAEITVTDDGRGIPEEKRSQVFDPFYTTRIGDGGTGLGLSVVHGVIRDHEGKVDISAPASGGTRFRVMLPIAKDGVATT